MGCDVKCSVRQSSEKNRLVDLNDDRTRTDTYIRNVRIRYAHALKKRRIRKRIYNNRDMALPAIYLISEPGAYGSSEMELS